MQERVHRLGLVWSGFRLFAQGLVRASLITAAVGQRLARQLTQAAAWGVAGPTNSARGGSPSSPAHAGASRPRRSLSVFLSPPRRSTPAVRAL